MAKDKLCDSCQSKPGIRNGVLEGKFGFYCSPCLSGQTSSGQSAQWLRDRDSEDHREDLVQPWHPDGSANSEFYRLYPDEAKEMFSEEELEEM